MSSRRKTTTAVPRIDTGHLKYLTSPVAPRRWTLASRLYEPSAQTISYRLINAGPEQSPNIQRQGVRVGKCYTSLDRRNRPADSQPTHPPDRTNRSYWHYETCGAEGFGLAALDTM